MDREINGDFCGFKNSTGIGFFYEPESTKDFNLLSVAIPNSHPDGLDACNSSIRPTKLVFDR